MGYTHYWTQLRDFDAVAFAEITADLLAILADAQARYEVAICDGAATPHSRPEVGPDRLAFNGTDIGDRGHETFQLERVRSPDPYRAAPLGWVCCKTARKPYDIAVTAALCYLATIAENHIVSSDGTGRDFLARLTLARQALPRHANRLDIPRGILEADRWCAPYVRLETDRYAVRFCIDGRAYLLDPTGRSLFRFVSHFEAARWLSSHTEPGRTAPAPLFQATGAFDQRRMTTLALAQERVLAALVVEGMAAAPALGRRLPPLRNSGRLLSAARMRDRVWQIGWHLGVVRLLFDSRAPAWVRIMPPYQRGLFKSVWTRPNASFANDWLDVYARTPRHQYPAASPGSLGSIPVIVISHGRGSDFLGPEFESSWSSGQAVWTRLSSRSTHVVAVHSGHAIAQENPALVARATALIVAKLRHDRNEAALAHPAGDGGTGR